MSSALVRFQLPDSGFRATKMWRAGRQRAGMKRGHSNITLGQRSNMKRSLKITIALGLLVNAMLVLAAIVYYCDWKEDPSPQAAVKMVEAAGGECVRESDDPESEIVSIRFSPSFQSSE